MKRFNFIVIVVFVLSLLTAFGLNLASSDYEFIPEKQSAIENNAQYSQTQITQEQILQYCRIFGDPVKDGVQAQVIFLNPLQKVGDSYLIFQVTIDIYTEKVFDYKITDLVMLEDSKGRKITQGFEWQESDHSNGSHIMGILMVPNLKGRESLLEDDVEWIKLTIEWIEERNMEFKWENEIM